MDPTSPAVHARHDEALIARLFGGDVSEAERARALALVSECPECESLLADFGAIAEATAALPVPPRPRDFSLTEADAARLRGKTRARSRVFRLGLRRSLGGSLAALGIFGLIIRHDLDPRRSGQHGGRPVRPQPGTPGGCGAGSQRRRQRVQLRSRERRDGRAGGYVRVRSR
jgi:anti-sigma factor RsiW